MTSRPTYLTRLIQDRFLDLTQTSESRPCLHVHQTHRSGITDMSSKPTGSRNATPKRENDDMSDLQSKAKAMGIVGWKILDREDLEFFIKEFEGRK